MVIGLVSAIVKREVSGSILVFSISFSVWQQPNLLYWIYKNIGCYI